MPRASNLFQLLKPKIKLVTGECQWAVALSENCRLLQVWQIGRHVLIDIPRAVVRLGGVGVATVASYPAADFGRVQADRQFVEELRRAADMLGVVYWNHVVVSYGSIYSAWAERGWLCTDH